MSAFKTPSKKLTGYYECGFISAELTGFSCRNFKIAKSAVVCSEAELYGDVTIGGRSLRCVVCETLYVSV